MNFPSTQGKYIRDAKWRKKRSKYSKVFWAEVDRDEMHEKMSNGWTIEARKKQSKYSKKLWTPKRRKAWSIRMTGAGNNNYLHIWKNKDLVRQKHLNTRDVIN